MQQKQCRLININVKLSKMLHCESKCTSTLGFHCCSLRATTVRINLSGTSSLMLVDQGCQDKA